MKKKLLGLFAGIAMTLGLASCSDDQNLSINMSGEWSGCFGSNYTILDADGYAHTYQASETYLRFLPDHDYATHGRGTQVDYYDRGPYDCLYYQFDWEVENERIYLTYPDYPEMNVTILRFEMDSHHFSGRCGYGSFSLCKISDYYDWTPYDHDHGYRTRALSTRSEAGPEFTIISRGNDMMTIH